MSNFKAEFLKSMISKPPVYGELHLTQHEAVRSYLEISYASTLTQRFTDGENKSYYYDTVTRHEYTLLNNGSGIIIWAITTRFKQYTDTIVDEVVDKYQYYNVSIRITNADIKVKKEN